MLTVKQKKWINQLSNTDKIKIVPYDNKAEMVFKSIQRKIKVKSGHGVEVLHRGASALKISGQDEIDVYIPVTKKDFTRYLTKMQDLFGKPRSLIPFIRVRFMVVEENKKIDLFLVNKESKEWKDNVKFFEYLNTHPSALIAYEQLKEKGNGFSVRRYYRDKTKFINKILGN